jgi:hypothetical protein
MAALDGVVRLAKMGAGAAASDFFGDLDCHCGHEGGTTTGSGGSVRLSYSSPRGADGGGGAIGNRLVARSLGSFCSKMVVCRLPALMDLAIYEFRNVPPEIFVGCLTPVDCWIGMDSVVCAPISAEWLQEGVMRSFGIC